LVTIKLNDMKENELILMKKKIEQLTNVVNG